MIRLVVIGGTLMLAVAPVSLRAQGTLTSTTASIPAPTEAQYDSTVSAPASVLVNASCTGANDCSFKIVALAAGLEWRVASITSIITGGQSACIGVATAWSSVPATIVSGIRKSKVCNIVLEFRVTGMSYARYQAPSTTLFTTQFAITSP